MSHAIDFAGIGFGQQWFRTVATASYFRPAFFDHVIGVRGITRLPNGVVEKACGAGGGTSQQDEDCAPAGVAKP